jgi:glycosyltransferase involved in cell wall biosynthesis
MHAQLLTKELERANWTVRLVTLERLPLPLRYAPHLVSKVVNWFDPPMGFYYKDRVTRLLYKWMFNQDTDLRIFEDIYLTWNSSIPSVTLLHAVWSDNLQSVSAQASAVARLVKAEEETIDSIEHPIITVSDQYRDSLVKSHGRSRRLPHVAVVPLGMDMSEFDAAIDSRRSAKSLVYCGALEPRKNLRFLLDVFRQLHQADGNYRLTIVGDGPDHEELERYVVQHALPVTFRGRLSRSDLIEELSHHNVYVHPSVKESFSFALLEAKVAGLKTVAFAGLEVPREFIDVPVQSFEASDWMAAITRAGDAVPQPINRDDYSAQRMLTETLRLAHGALGAGHDG